MERHVEGGNMLLHLHVRNLALIDSAEVDFGHGLNILTGETGAGKSILIGSVNTALGGKTSKDMIRQGADSASVELVFSVDSDRLRKALADLDVEPDEDGLVIVSRKITPQRSLSRINDETVTAAKLRSITSLLIDVHGQNDHQSLLYKSRHLEILDAFGKEETAELREKTAETYRRYAELKRKLETFTGDEDQRLREQDFLNFEIREIEEAELKPDEEEALEQDFRRMNNARRIGEHIRRARNAMDMDGTSDALAAVKEAYRFDENLKNIHDMLYDMDSMAEDLRRSLDEYMEEMSFDEERFHEAEERLDTIHNLEAKYGKTIPDVLEALERMRGRLTELEHFEEARKDAECELSACSAELEKLCGKLTEKRQKTAKKLTGEIARRLLDLNFLDARFRMEFRRLDHFTADGWDETEFMMSANPGEPVRPLGEAASGGELSRVMLAIRTVLAETDDIPTLIFDEIDTGISGRTAQKVSEQLRMISERHQVILITHLPQIAAMADQHYEIRKSVANGRTVTGIHALTQEEMCEELARLLGGAEITDAVRQNAAEMKRLADAGKNKRRQELT